MILVRRSDERKDIRIGVGTSLLVLIALEASLLGSGRLLLIGPLTGKMWLFLIAQMYVAWRLMAFGRLKLSTLVIILSFTLLLCFGATIGLLQRTTLDLIGEDVKPLLFCFMLVFFEMIIRTEKHVRLVIKIMEFASILMSIGYIATLVLLFSGFLRFSTLYGWLQRSSQEFFFRGESGLFFYKGAIYIGIGLICFAFERNRLAKLAMMVAIMGLIETGTRGFFVGLAAVVLVHLATGASSLRKKLKYIVPAFAGAFLILVLSSSVLSNKAGSDSTRIENLHQVEDRITPLSFVFGHGLGVGVPLRPDHMEIAYLEIFHKQGLLGLTWWTSMLVLLFMRYRRARRINYRYAQPLFLSGMFIVFESATNSFINNPIGIFVWSIALVGLDVISEDRSPAGFLEQRECAVS